MTRSTLSAALIGSCALLAATATVRAVPTVVQSQDTPHCDPLMNLINVDELGDAPVFPTNELISSFSTFTQLVACPSHDNPAFPNTLVRITNLSGSSWIDLHYVADPAAGGVPGTTISNEDGLVNGGQAFRIDKVGVNTPLLSESITSNGIFEPGEIWDFVIDDYSHATGAAATPFDSIGVGVFSAGLPSTGSIIAIPVPEPGSLAASSAIGVALLARRRPGHQRRWTG